MRLRFKIKEAHLCLFVYHWWYARRMDRLRTTVTDESDKKEALLSMHLLTSSNRIVDQNLFTNWHNYKYNFTFHEKPSRQVFLHLMPISVWFKLQTPFLVFLQWTTGTYVKRNLLIWTEITNGLENQIFWLSKKLDFFWFLM